MIAAAWASVLCLSAGLLATVGAAPVKQSPARLDYTRDIRPILADKCFACHGLDEKKRQSSLRLDSRGGAYGKAASGQPAIIPGKPGLSNLVKRISAHDGTQMPPAGSGKKLTPEQIATLRRWVGEGARYAAHWAFVKPVRPAVPAIQNPESKIQNPIDAFILARLKSAGLQPSPDADRYTLIRRASLDLIGLPPAPAEVDAFVNDRSPSAYEKLVDRLLASPHFGERWARMWLDLARYADSSGYGSDPLRPNLWPWRDWVINAFNRNMPYDQFTIEQIAGDLLPNPTREQLIATAFHRNTMTNTEGGTDREEFRTAAVKDRTITTAQVWMGLTMQCAQCHSHKYDPIPQRDFYRLMACFNQTEDNDQPNETPTMPLLTHDQEQQKAKLSAEIADLEAKAAKDPSLKPQLDAKKKERDAVKPVELPVMRELPGEKRRKSHILTLGNFLMPQDEVEPGVPTAFNSLPAGCEPNRLGVARWLLSPDNPLTARVAVNRFWAQIFGRGIVETEEDFGTQGSLPTHPELLDWLACEFMKPSAPGARPWDMKRTLKLIVMSSTYRQSSRVTPVQLEKDPRNLLLSHYPRRRLPAEAVRDNALAISGLLSQKIGGPSVFPPQPEGLWRPAFNGERTWPTSTGEDRYRRGIYTFWRRTIPYPSQATFDAPSRETCTIRRIPTNTPLQALITLNDPAYLEMAQALGRRIEREGGTTTESRVRYALRLALSRPPVTEQTETLTGLYQTELARYKAAPADAAKLATDPLGPLPTGMDPAEQASWTVVANVLLNMDGTLTKN